MRPDLGRELVDLASEKLPDLAMIVVHGGGAKGKGLRREGQICWGRGHRVRGAEAVGTATVRFSRGEASRRFHRGGRGSSRSSMRSVTTSRALAAAVTQLISDGQGGPITVDQVRRYFGGRAEVTSFAVADAALAGRTGAAMEQLRWALATGVAPVLITSAWPQVSAAWAS